jgi:hypothetical protein
VSERPGAPQSPNTLPKWDELRVRNEKTSIARKNIVRLSKRGKFDLGTDLGLGEGS